jgi:hypothetical protein
MKKALEAVLVAVTLAIGFFVIHAWLAQRRLAARPAPTVPLGPGLDLEDPNAPAPPGRQRGSVVELPRVKLTRPPKPAGIDSAVPPPAAAP